MMRFLGKRLARFMLALAVWLLLAGPPPASEAHPADQYFQEHNLRLTPAGVELTWTISTGPVLVPVVWGEADQEQDDQVTPAEARAWVERRLPDLPLTLDGTAPLVWQIESIAWPSSFVTMQLGDEKIVVELSAAWPETLSGPHQLTFYNRYFEEISIAWFYLRGDQGVTFRPPSQQNGLLQLEFQPGGPGGLTAWDTGTPTLPAGSPPPKSPQLTTAAAPALPEGSQATATLTGLIRTPDLSLSFLLIALGTAALLGALHALTPGHGKTVVAAYLVGSRGTTLHAISLGSIVTLTHTGSVFLLGLVTLLASQYILPSQLFPILEITSGLLIVGLGAHLLYRRWREWRAGSSGHHHHHDHDHDHHHHHHDHHHHDHDHHHDLPDKLTWRSLIALGVSGGLVPCPDAIAILLVAVVINRIALGLSMIVAFSLGLALVLIVIGLAMVHSRRLFEKMDSFGRLAPLMPLVSAVVVLLLGLGLTAGALRGTSLFGRAGAAELVSLDLGAAPPAEVTAQTSPPPFDLGQARILYLAPDSQARKQLFVIGLRERQPRPLTSEPYGVSNYALAPTGQTVVYTALRGEGGSNLALINTDGSGYRLLLDCGESTCSGPVWSPDGGWLLYESDLASLKWLDPASGAGGPLFQDSGLPSFAPRWSPDGAWLSYVSPANSGVQLYQLAEGRSQLIPSRTGAPAVWSPTGQAVLVSDVRQQDSQFLTQLRHFELASGQLTDLSASERYEDSWVAWSPDGAWLAVVRKEIGPEAALGTQLWLMRPDGSEARPLLEMPEMLYREPVWAPDGRSLLLPAYRLAERQTQPGLWLVTVDSGQAEELVPSGNQPTWLPF